MILRFSFVAHEFHSKKKGNICVCVCVFSSLEEHDAHFVALNDGERKLEYSNDEEIKFLHRARERERGNSMGIVPLHYHDYHNKKLIKRLAVR